MPLKEKKISYQEDWRRQHWNSLMSAYQNSPYFEYYAQQIHACLYQSHVFLIDLHMELLLKILKWLNWDGTLSLTEEYLSSDRYEFDLRQAFDPSLKSFPSWFVPVRYPQVFDGFQPGLSILDLLCNEGPVSRGMLLNSFRQD